MPPWQGSEGTSKVVPSLSKALCWILPNHLCFACFLELCGLSSQASAIPIGKTLVQLKDPTQSDIINAVQLVTLRCIL
jgi:hypothetical protein